MCVGTVVSSAWAVGLHSPLFQQINHQTSPFSRNGHLSSLLWRIKHYSLPFRRVKHQFPLLRRVDQRLVTASISWMTAASGVISTDQIPDIWMTIYQLEEHNTFSKNQQPTMTNFHLVCSGMSTTPPVSKAHQ